MKSSVVRCDVLTHNIAVLYSNVTVGTARGQRRPQQDATAQLIGVVDGLNSPQQGARVALELGQLNHALQEKLSCMRPAA